MPKQLFSSTTHTSSEVSKHQSSLLSTESSSDYLTDNLRRPASNHQAQRGRVIPVESEHRDEKRENRGVYSHDLIKNNDVLVME